MEPIQIEEMLSGKISEKMKERCLEEAEKVKKTKTSRVKRE